MSRMGLTERQMECLAFIKRTVDAGNKAPTFDEIKLALGLKQKSGVHRLLSALEDRGYIRRLPGRSRAIAVIDESQKTALDILPRDSRNFLLGFAKAEGKSPEVLMSEWIRERCEYEHRAANDFSETRTA